MAGQQNTHRGPGGGGGRGGPPRGGFAKPKDLKGTILRMFSYITRRPVMLVLALLCVVAGSVSNIAAT